MHAAFANHRIATRDLSFTACIGKRGQLMVRAHWTVDLPEAHIVAGLLREEGVPAWVFDAEMVRQDWFRAIAIGGYRVVVASDDAALARAIVTRYIETATNYAEDDMPKCPACGRHAATDDPWPRRAAFAVVMVGPHVSLVSLIALASQRAGPKTVSLAFAAELCIMIAFLVPGVLARLVKHRYLCIACGRRFRDDRGARYSDLSAATLAAESAVH
ncbi:MAG TPA: hypothetical protein VHE32_00905 [Rhodanobacteraceae bacterium]|nr:hypothetical protein [Rhodanobacteraceae bacterium]